MSSRDTLFRFLFEHSPVRGEMVQLDDTWQAVLHRRDYPPAVQALLGEFMAAAALLSATIKFDGALTIQAQGDGPVSLLVIECTSDHAMRATAKWHEPLNVETVPELIGPGKLVITIDPGPGKERYQGIVALQGDSVAKVLEGYLKQSEQLATHLWLAADDRRACGLMIQKLPGQEADNDAWETAEQLSATITRDEMLTVEASDMIYRLFHAENVRLFDGEPMRFACSCSRERVIDALRTIGYDEAHSVLEERGAVEVDCEFCGEQYRFDAVDLEQVFAASVVSPADQTRH